MKRFSETPYNQIQIKRMAEELDIFMRGKTPLGVLVKQLKGLFWSLQSPDDIWKDDFISEWGALETTHALELSRKEQGLTSEKNTTGGVYPTSEFVQKCVEKIQSIVQKEIIE